MMILKYLSLLLVLHVLFQPSTCMKEMSADQQTKLTTAYAGLKADKVFDKCFKEKDLDSKITTIIEGTTGTCSKLEEVFKCIYKQPATSVILGELTAETKTFHVMMVEGIRGEYLKENPKTVLAKCKIDPEKIVQAGEKKGSAMDEKDADKQSAGTRNHGAGVVGAILMAAAVVIVI